MKIKLNGEEHITEEAGSIEDLLTELNVHPERVAVEVNLKIIKKSDYKTVTLKEGDLVEVVSFVGGGSLKV